MVGITAYGAYLPKLRLQRKAISEANAWFDTSLKGLASGERTMCNWDEDSITMAVEACRACLGDQDRANVRALFMASTSAPFLDRQNSVVISEALTLDVNIRSMDVSGSQRAGTSALLSAIDAVATIGRGKALVVAAEHRRSKCASKQEMVYGDGAVAIELGSDGVIAELVEAHSTSVDFVDRYRSDGFQFDVQGEERWIRDEGYLKLVPNAVNALLQKAGIEADAVRHFILPAEKLRIGQSVAREIGFSAESVADNLIEECGFTGTSHPLLLLAHSLEKAAPGDLIIVVGFGQGCDTFLFKVTDEILRYSSKGTVSRNLSRGLPENNYNKFISFNNLVEMDYGKRSEVDKNTYLSALYRDHKFLNGFMGGRCSACGTVQIPLASYCVNPKCNALHSQQEYCLSESKGHVVTWTADALTFDFSPPAYFGLVEFVEGGRLMVDFTEVDPDKFASGVSVTMHFRIRQIDNVRGFRRYFWKCKQSQ
jgi:3-hydroxy-3-methylglutaryl CoA synthase